MINCLTCQKDTNNPKFCSRSCSTSYFNQIKPKRQRTRKCRKCNLRVVSHDVNYCAEHLEMIKQKVPLKECTLAQYQSKESVANKHPSWKNAHIRGLNRSWNKHLIQKPCANCGYTKHVELCHIKPIGSFNITAKLKEVNAPENLIQLCPNCHWEFDNGFLLCPNPLNDAGK